MRMNEEKKFFAFVLMPFDKEFDGIYEDFIKVTLETAGYEVKRADDLIDQRSILKNIVCSIVRADLVIADLTTLNANVLYELGIAHTMQKPTVMIVQDTYKEEVPFDLRPYSFIPYSEHYKEVEKFRKNLLEIANKLIDGSISFGNPVSDFAHSIPRYERATSERPKPNEQSRLAEIQELEEEPGMWDFIVEAENSLKEIGEYTKRMADLGFGFAEKINSRSLEITSIKDSSTPGSAARIHNKLKAAARDITEYAEKIEVELPGFKDSWSRFEQNSMKLLAGIVIVNGKDKEELTKLKEATEVLLNAVVASIASQRELKEKASGLKGLSRDFNRAIGYFLKTQDALITELTKGESYLKRIINLIAERMNKRKE